MFSIVPVEADARIVPRDPPSSGSSELYGSVT